VGTAPPPACASTRSLATSCLQLRFDRRDRPYYAVAVALDGAGSTTLFNAGTIAAYADPSGSVAFLSGAGDDSVLNYGGIYGALVTGAGDDSCSIASGASWYAFGVSDFGDGDDSILNNGRST
jgi:hypothetical protein